MRWIFLGLLILSVIGIYLSAQQQDQRDVQQTALLVRLERVGTDDARTVVDEWRREHSSPSTGDIQGLTLLVERVERDPGAAKEHTAAARSAAKARLCEKISMPFGDC
ncbi:hypothetical protein J3A72_000468 [Stenotrophomonas sp. PvP093]|uniref:hypothetical protein n=1 Tax=unclassified Stenotrophomonas TaxID=196198 RepID=UPI001AEAEF1E|nr:hypothetical protein [Stenotrophomonas sp. PvP093]MBP2480176.1 hypothetical protein [Stenotrophomonas sp. PvP093]